MPYARLIVNPVAGAKRTAKKWPQIMRLLKSIGLHFEHDLTEAPGHATELAKSAAEKGYELVNGLYAGGNITDVMLGIISTETGGDYIRTIGIPRAYQEACQCFINPGKLTVDVGVVEYVRDCRAVKRLFVNFAGLGFDAEIVKATTQKFKALNSTASYLMGLLTTLLFYKNKKVSLIVDGEAVEGKVCTV